MCLERVEVENLMVTWGNWQWQNAGYGSGLGYSTDGKCAREHLITGACGGGNKVEEFSEMPKDVAFVDANLTQLNADQKLICKLMFVQSAAFNESMKSRTSFAKKIFINKFKKTSHGWRKSSESLWSVLCVVLDKPKIMHNHPYFEYERENNTLQCAS